MRSLLLSTIFIPLYTCGLFAQSLILSGTVYDAETGEPMLGATVIAGESGTTTDIDGVYEISIGDGVEEVRFSFVGYETQRVSISESVSGTPLVIYLAIAENILETAVVTGSKYEQTLAESVVSIDVLRPQLIQSTNTNDVEDIFNKIPGVQMIDGQPNIRSGSGWSYNAGNRVMLLIDDIPALQPDAGRASWSDIPVENIAQIEVIKGAGSTLYGSAAMNGVINVRTGYATSEPETQLSIFHTRYGDYTDDRKNWYRTDDIDRTPMDIGFSASHKQKIGKLDLVAAMFYYEQDSTRSFRNQDFRNKLRGNLNLRYRATDRLTFGVNTIVNTGRSSSFFLWKNATIGALQPLEGTVALNENTRYTIDPHVTYYDKKDNRHRFQSRIYYNDNENNLDQSNLSQMYYGEYQFLRSFSDDLTFTAGAVLSHSSSDSELFQSADIWQRNAAGYFQIDQAVGDKLNLTGGLRYEYNKQVNDFVNHPTIAVDAGEKAEGRFIGRLGANYQLADHTYLRGSLGQAYRFPIMIERFLSTSFSGFTVLPNPDLVSETGITGEIGIKQGLQFGPIAGYIDVAVYDSRYQDMMEFVFVSDPTFGFQSQNIGDTRITGFEISTGGKIDIGSVPIQFYGGYNYANPRYQDYASIEDFVEETSSVAENILKYRSKHSFSMDVQASYDRLSGGVAIQGASHMIAVDKILESFITNLESYRALNDNGFYILDARVAYDFDFVQLSLHAKNILNREYTQRPGIIEAPRNFAIRADFDLQHLSAE